MTGMRKTDLSFIVNHFDSLVSGELECWWNRSRPLIKLVRENFISYFVQRWLSWFSLKCREDDHRKKIFIYTKRVIKIYSFNTNGGEFVRAKSNKFFWNHFPLLKRNCCIIFPPVVVSCRSLNKDDRNGMKGSRL